MTRKYLLTVYIFLNVLCATYFSAIGSLGGDFKYDYPADVISLLLSTVVVLLTFAIVQGLIFGIFERIPVKKYICFNRSGALDLIMFFIGVLSVFFTIYFKVGVLGVSKDIADDAPKFVFYFNTIFQPVFFILIYLFYRYDSEKLIYYINALIYIALVLVSGQTAQILLLFCLYLIRKKKNNFIKLCFLTIIGIGFYPFIRMAKDAVVQAVNSGGELGSSLSNMLAGIDMDTYFSYLFITLERFQIVSNISYIIDNGEKMSYLFSMTGSSHSFFSLNWLISALMRFLSQDISSLVSAQDFVAVSINGVSTWSSQIGLLGYFYFYNIYSLAILLVIFIGLFITIRISMRMSRNRELVNLTWFISLLLICHGWLIPFLNYAQSVFLFFLLIIFLNFGKKFMPALNKRATND